MKALMLTGIRQVEMQDVPAPQIADDTDVLIRMEAVGVCGSDCHYYANGKIGTQVVEYPFAVGHEGAGVVEAVGSAVSRVTPGDRIAFDPAMPCGQCDQCRVGRPHTCRELRFLGCPGQAPGCLTEQIVLPEECCFPIQDTTTFEQAALGEPLAIGVYAVQRAELAASAAVGILGAGPIGLSVMLPAKHQGCGPVYMTDKIDARLAVARAGGADWTGNPEQEDVVAAIEALEPDQLDVVFECCGDPAALDQAVGLVKPGGRIMLVGIPEDNRISMDINHLRHKEIDLRNVRRQNGCVLTTLAMIQSGEVNVDFMVTHRFRFDQGGEAMDLVTDYQDGVVKAMIGFD
jgi:L-iditol 2-dehydrogenase